MTIKECIIFQAVAEEKNMAAAAEKLYMSRQALSASVRQLEEELGCRLFDRSKAGCELTEDGKYFAAQSGRLLQIVEETKAHFKKPAQHTLKIGFSAQFLRRISVAKVMEFTKLYPHVSLDISALGADECWNSLLISGGIDLAFHRMPPKFSREFTLKRIMSYRAGFLVSPESPLSAKSVLHAEDLADQRILLSAPMKKVETQLSQIPCEFKMLAIDRATMNQVIRDNYGIAPFPMVRPDEMDDSLAQCKLIPFEDERLDYSIYLGVRREMSKQPPIAAFIRYMSKLCKEMDE